MRKIGLLFLFFFNLIPSVFSQNKGVISWLNNNAYLIENGNFNTDITIPNHQLSASFTNATVFGFGEATHHSKEFIQLKAKFFKYLVLNHHVKVFVLEESFGASYLVNEYINGRGGNLKEILSHFKQGIWKTQDLFELINWMKSYNEDKVIDKKIQFYGNDCMFNYGLVSIINKIILDYGIELDPNEKKLLKFYENEISIYNDKKILELNANEITKLNEDLFFKSNNYDLKNTLNALAYFNEFLINPNQEVRDKNMFLHVVNLKEFSKYKIFVCAHNSHIHKTNVDKSIPSMGKLLYEKYKKLYFAVGFEFGIGKFFSHGNEDVILDKPIKNTNSEFLFQVNKDIFYFDFSIASEDLIMRDFLNEKRAFVFIGGYGLNLKYLKYNIFSEKYINNFDGLIYVKNISESNPLK
jgi:erythromycin esterase